MWTVNNFSARSMLSGWSRQGYKACPSCNGDTSSICLRAKQFMWVIDDFSLEIAL